MGATQTVTLIIGATLACALILWTPRPPGHIRPPRLTPAATPTTLVLLLIPLSAGLLVGWATTLLFGVTAAVLVAISEWALLIRSKSTQTVREADQLAQLTSGLANQATVAATVSEAITKTAPLVGGQVGIYARNMAAELEIVPLPEAATRFALKINKPLAFMAADVLEQAHTGGIKWGGIMNVLDQEAAAAATTARHFHRYVGRQMNQVVVTILIATGVVALTGWVTDSTREWFLSGNGQLLVLMSTILIAGLHIWILNKAHSQLR